MALKTGNPSAPLTLMSTVSLFRGQILRSKMQPLNKGVRRQETTDYVKGYPKLK
jgi:hypothetical protein